MVARIASLETALAAEKKKAVVLREEVATASAKGEAEGHRRGLAEAESKEAERITRLGKGMDEANAVMRQELAASEDLAYAVAAACLEKLFGQESSRADLVTDLIRHQMARLGRHAVVAMTISVHDFSEEALETLRAMTGLADVQRSPNLPPGGCILKPRLGEMDIGLDTQWSAIRDFLEQLAFEERSL